MKKKAPAITELPAIETSPIRLSVDETRLIMKATTEHKPIRDDYRANALAELGIMQRIEIPEEKDTKTKIDECWKRAKNALSVKDGERLHQAMHDLERLSNDRDRNDTKYAFILTPLGKQIARGITIRMNGQYMNQRVR